MYKSTANNVIKRLTGPRFSEARRQLSDGEFPLNDFIKGKNPKPQRRPQTSREDVSPQKAPGARPVNPHNAANPVNRSRGVRPPPAGARGMRGAPVARGSRGARGMPARGGFNQPVEPVANPLLPVASQLVDEINDEEQVNEDKTEESKQQPAIQIPERKEELEPKDSKTKVRVELEPEHEVNERATIPPIKQVESEDDGEGEGSPDNIKDSQAVSSNLPKTSHRRGQPPSGNLNAQPPIASRGRGHRGGPVPRGRGGKPPNFNQRPVPPQVQAKPKDTIEIVEDEIVHEGEQRSGDVQESPQHKSSEKKEPLSGRRENARKESDEMINYDIVENKDYEESENKKREVKAMFGKIFENDGSDNSSRSRGRSPNFSEQRYATPDEDAAEDYRALSKPKEKSKRAKTHRKNNDLNKSVDLFATSGARIVTEPLLNEPNNAMNTSFGVENASELHDALDNDEGISAKIFASSNMEEAVNRSKTPPVDSRRVRLQQESNDKSSYHKPIGAKEDFIIEEPVIEPMREDTYQGDNQSISTPEMKANTETKEKVRKRVKEERGPKTTIEGDNDKKRKEMLYDEDDDYRNKTIKSDFTESTILNIKENLKANSTPGTSTVGEGKNQKGLNISKYDQTVPISHTSSVRSVPDEVDRLTDNLKAKKQECEELKKQLEERDNELQVQIQLNNTLKLELQNERSKNQNNSVNKQLEAENKELWDIINQIRKEQESYKNSIFLTLRTFSSNLPKSEPDQSIVLNREEGKIIEEETKLGQTRAPRYSEQEYIRQEQSKIDKVQPVARNRHLETMTQEMMNNAAGSGSNQEDYLIQEKNNEEEYDDEIEYDAFEDDYNEEGTSGGNAKPISHEKDYRRMKYDQTDNNLEADDRVIQGNERRGRQKQSKKRRGHNINALETGRDSGDDYEEEEKIPGVSSSSGIQSHQYKKREKGKQSQPFGRQSETPSSGQFSNLPKHDTRLSGESYMHNIGVAGHVSQANQRHRQADPRQTYSTGDSSFNQKQNRRKDQKLSAESGGTDFNQNPSTQNQMEELKSSVASHHYPYEGTIQGSTNSATLRAANRPNVPHLNIAQRAGSPEGDQRNYPNIGLDGRGNFDEDVLLGENEISTPRRQEQLENESKKTSGASTPSRDGADTPTRKNFNEHQQQLGENTSFIHDLTASNVSRKYPIDRKRVNPHASDSGRNVNTMPSNNTFTQMSLGDQMEFGQPLGSQNSYDEREGRRGHYNAGRQEVDYEGEYQNYQDNNYWEREQEQQHVRESRGKRKKIQPNVFD